MRERKKLCSWSSLIFVWAYEKQHMKNSPKVIDIQEGYNKNFHEDNWTKWTWFLVILLRYDDVWYVSNISIIFIAPCYYITPFGCLWALFYILYIIFGTNLLTGGPARIAVFLPISVFRRKGISNGVQTEWNLREHDFWNKYDLESLEYKSRSLRGGHEVGGRA